MSLRGFAYIFSFAFFVFTYKTVAADSEVSGQLLEYKLVKYFPADELKIFFKKHHIPKIVLPVNKGMNIYEVTYVSTYADNSNVKASGLAYVPIEGDKALP